MDVFFYAPDSSTLYAIEAPTNAGSSTRQVTWFSSASIPPRSLWLRGASSMAPAPSWCWPCPEGGTDHTGPLAAPYGLADLSPMVVYGGRDRSAAEFADLFAASGLRFARVIDTGALCKWVEGVAANLLL